MPSYQSSSYPLSRYKSRAQHRKIYALIGLSLAVHGSLLLLVPNWTPTAEEDQSAKPLQFSLVQERTSFTDAPPDPQVPISGPARPPQIPQTDIAEVTAESRDLAAPDTTVPDSTAKDQPPTQPAPTTRGLSADQFRFNVQSQARQIYHQPTCTLKEKHSQVRPCTQEAFRDHRPMAELIASMTPDLSGREHTIRQSLDRAEQIIAEANNLALLQPDDPAAQAALLTQQQHLRDELLRIDAQLASVNLLRVFPMAAKVIRGLENARE